MPHPHKTSTSEDVCRNRTVSTPVVAQPVRACPCTFSSCCDTKRRAGLKLRYGNVVDTNLVPFPVLILLGEICPSIVTVGRGDVQHSTRRSIDIHSPVAFRFITSFQEKYSWNVKKRVLPSGVRSCLTVNTKDDVKRLGEVLGYLIYYFKVQIFKTQNDPT